MVDPSTSLLHMRTDRAGLFASFALLGALAVTAIGCSSDGSTTPATTSATTAPPATAAPTNPPTNPPANPPTAVAPTTTEAPSTSTTTSTTTTTLAPTTTTPPIVTAGAIVLVANASAVPGAAAKLTTTFGKLGFTTRPPLNAAGADEDLTISRIYAAPGSEPVALSVARLMGDIAVLPMPTPVPIDGASAGDATVIVMLGHDLAGKRLPGA